MSKKVEAAQQPQMVPGYGYTVPAQKHLSGRDGAQYVRQQKGHSLLFNLFIIGPITMYITTVYYSVSKNHYWHL